MNKPKKLKINKIKFTRKKILMLYGLLTIVFLIAIVIYASSIYYAETEIPPLKEKSNIVISEEDLNNLGDLKNLEKDINTKTGVGKSEPFR